MSHVFSKSTKLFYRNRKYLKEALSWQTLLKDVPKPAFGSIFSVSTSDDEVAVTFSGWNQEQLMDYIGLVKAAGFTKNAEEMTIMGMSTYEADNGSVRLEIVQAMGYYAITVEKL